jgi:hypothetical protein
MRKLITAAVLGLSLAVAPLTAAPAQATGCDMANWTFPLCKIGRPSIPHYNMGGPRPPLAEKTSVWCTKSFVSAGAYYGWYLTVNERHVIRFWPDYYSRVYVGVYWNGFTWTQSRVPVYTFVDCDA